MHYGNSTLSPINVENSRANKKDLGGVESVGGGPNNVYACM
jgi:hypothetical protein